MQPLSKIQILLRKAELEAYRRGAKMKTRKRRIDDTEYQSLDYSVWLEAFICLALTSAIGFILANAI